MAIVANSFKHGHAKPGNATRTYRSWCKMKQRCESRTAHNWEHYGGRGIAVCERWQQFEFFLEDMGERPDDATLERIDNSLGYSPDNCKWATKSEQARNRRSNTMLTIYGKTMCLAAWIAISGAKQGTVSMRLKAGWAHKQAVFGKG